MQPIWVSCLARTSHSEFVLAAHACSSHVSCAELHCFSSAHSTLHKTFQYAFPQADPSFRSSSGDLPCTRLANATCKCTSHQKSSVVAYSAALPASPFTPRTEAVPSAPGAASRPQAPSATAMSARQQQWTGARRVQ